MKMLESTMRKITVSPVSRIPQKPTAQRCLKCLLASKNYLRLKDPVRFQSCNESGGITFVSFHCWCNWCLDVWAGLAVHKGKVTGCFI